MKKKTTIRIITLILAFVLAFGTLSSVLMMLVNAAVSTAGVTNSGLYKIISADTTVSPTLTAGKVTTGVKITFNFLPDMGSPGSEFTFESLSMPADSSFGWTSKTKLKIDPVIKSGSVEYYRATLSNVTYTGGSSRNLELFINDEYCFSVPISSKYFKESSSSGEDLPVSDIVVQSVTVRNASGEKLNKVEKDAPPFNVEVTFYDVGLADESKTSLQQAKIHAFITSAAGFKTLSGTSGKVEVLTSATQYPRFKATFSDIQSDGTGNSIGFRIQYDLTDYEKSVKGEATAQLFQVENPETTANASLKPNVIIEQYSYGKDSIVAGDEFNLDLRFSNTSKTTAVENVVMTIEPGSGFVIAAASNTMYFQDLQAGQSQPYAVALRAAAAGNSDVGNVAGSQTDYSVQVKFSYQYLNKTEYVAGETSVKIAIPVIQLDRFSADEITDYEQYMVVGQEGYISVPISNKGKSPTYNITGSITGPEGSAFTAPVVHFGNLEAGKTGTIDMSITINSPGEFFGEAVVSYEDENMNQKQITKQFSIMVDEPFMPPPEMPPEDPGAVNGQGLGLYSIILCSVGGLLIAVPIALYLIKRSKARGSEDIDEAF